MKRIITMLFLGAIFITLCTAQASLRNFKQQGAATGTLESDELSVAHPSLPIGTYVKITNTDNNKVVYATVTNRITASVDRIADLSPDVAEAIGMPIDGSVPVLLERAARPVEPPKEPDPPPPPPPKEPDPPPKEPDPPPPDPSPPPPAPKPVLAKPPAQIIPRMPDPGNTTIFRVQVGSYLLPLHAKEAFERLVAAGLHPYYERFGDHIRVVIPGVPALYIPWLAQRLGNLDVREAWIRPER
jgi:rare lipoprotein A